ncbi:hypothetical protein [Deinococcus fonticola]|uniref:hypothetical protein n=1 Tax=Deinococcus fonticola TaxID=2528713 RepID=UPI001074A00C|nr:hypothetical protein [Deinococcus fonticola]
MGSMTPQLLSLAVMCLTIVQFVKAALGLDREWPRERERYRRPALLFISAAVGVACALGTMAPDANPLPNFPSVPVQVVLGIIAGLMASGGWEAVKQLQDRGIARRAELPGPELSVHPTVVVQPVPVEPEPYSAEMTTAGEPPTSIFDIIPGYEPVDPTGGAS